MKNINNKNKEGFTLLELLIAIAFSSMIAIMLYSMFTQIGKAVFSINEKTSYQMMVSTLYHQLEKDIYGACIPTQFLIQQNEQEKKKQSDSMNQASEQPDSQVKEKEVSSLKKIFYATAEKDSFRQFTFITRNALAFYTDKEQKDVMPLMVRVMYQLLPDEQGENTFRLVRSQGAQLDPKDYADENKVRSYELARRIKKMKLIFYKEVLQKDSSAEKQDTDSNGADVSEANYNTSSNQDALKKEVDQPKQFSKLITWSTDETKSGSSLLPAFIEVELTFDLEQERQEVERFMFEIAVSDMAVIMQSLPNLEQEESKPIFSEQTNEKVKMQNLDLNNQINGWRPNNQKHVSYKEYGPRGYQSALNNVNVDNEKSEKIIITANIPIKKVGE